MLILPHSTQHRLCTVSDENCGGTILEAMKGEEMISEPGYEQMGQCGAVSQTAWSQHMHDPSDIVLNWQYTQLTPCCTVSHETVTNTCSLASSLICVA